MDGVLVHSKDNGDGYVDTAEKDGKDLGSSQERQLKSEKMGHRSTY